MNEIQIWTDAESRNELIYRFKQADSPVLTQPGPWGRSLPNAIHLPIDQRKYNGYCAALAVRWCVHRLIDEDFPYDVRAKRCEGIADIEAVKQQSIYRGGTAGNNWQEAGDLQELFKRNNFLGTQQVYMAVGAYSSIIRNTVDATSEGLYYLSLKGSGGGHGVAVQKQDKVYRYWDANLGHFACQNGANFERLFARVMDFYKGFLDSQFYVFRLDAIAQPKTGATRSVNLLRQKFGG